MAILGNKDTKVIVQGITGGQGSFHTRLMMEYGTQVVGGVVPGKGGQWFEADITDADGNESKTSVPIFDTVQAAVEATGATAAASKTEDPKPRLVGLPTVSEPESEELEPPAWAGPLQSLPGCKP